MASIKLILNGKDTSIATDPERSLLEVLREDLQLTGTKYGCGEGQCRSCTVLVDGKEAASCTTRISDVAGKVITTIEGLSEGNKLHPIQQAFITESASQCGFCTPGMILGTVVLLKSHPKPTEGDVKAGLQQHLCRCCNYPRIINSVIRAASLVSQS